MIRIQCVIPHQGTLDTRLAVWLMRLMKRTRYDLHYAFPAYKPISSARNKIAREFLVSSAHFDYLLMIDSDVVPDGDPLQWVDLDLDIMAGMYPIWKGHLEPGQQVMWDFVPLPGTADDTSTGLVEAKGVGAGCMLIARRVLEHPSMRAPFREIYDGDGVIALGEDLAFCQRARAAGFRVWVDLELRCSHNKTIDLRKVGNAIYAGQGEPFLVPSDMGSVMYVRE